MTQQTFSLKNKKSNTEIIKFQVYENSPELIKGHVDSRDITNITSRDVFTWNIPDTLLAEIDRKPVSKYRLHIFLKDNQSVLMLSEITFADENGKKTKSIYVPATKEDNDKLFELVTTNGYIQKYRAHADIPKNGANLDDWLEMPVQMLFQEADKIYYQQLHDAVINNAKHLISSHSKQNLLIISAGCGNASELKNFYECFQIVPSLFLGGFDINADNITDATRTLQQLKSTNSNVNYYLENEDLSNLEQFTERCLKNFNLTTDSTTIVINFSGVLAEGIPKNQRSALLYFQAAQRHADIIIISSLTRPLLDGRIIKASGIKKVDIIRTDIKIPLNLTPYSNPIYICQNYSQTEKAKRIEVILKRSDKRNSRPGSCNLDLSYSSQPLHELQYLLENNPSFIHKVTQLDLSFSKINDNEVEIIANLIKSNMPNVTHILIGNGLPAEKEFIQLFETQTKIKLCKRLDTEEDSLPQYSIPTAKNHFKFYAALPNKTHEPPRRSEPPIQYEPKKK